MGAALEVPVESTEDGRVGLITRAAVTGDRWLDLGELGAVGHRGLPALRRRTVPPPGAMGRIGTIEAMRLEPIIVPASDGAMVTVRGSQIWFKATGADTDQAFSFIERVLPPGGRRPTPHRHTRCHEAFYILEGAVEFEIERVATVGAPGTFVLVPPGGLHTFSNRTEREARLLILHAPAMDQYFVELHELLLNGGDLSAERALMERFGMELVVESEPSSHSPPS